jgi:anti-sigma B factor antagonist
MVLPRGRSRPFKQRREVSAPSVANRTPPSPSVKKGSTLTLRLAADRGHESCVVGTQSAFKERQEQMTFSISVSRIKRLSITGALDADTASQLEPMLDALFSPPYRQVEVDLSGLRMIDSIGVGMLITVYKRLQARGITFSLRGLRDQPLAFFKLLGLHRLTTGSAAELY